ncbi:hypothetical protein N4T77_15750 [Clostridium sp. CX1]|uniref:hypothetical protein n=1 Tax=Clostridium sp. CX1 TaxID=2978346 RepID=UPI0021C16D7A|nr:hypothetical protein [Clostridium sp. CX1]MCT8978047.1 hypothetical protein [Clostridium sp. CX1]
MNQYKVTIILRTNPQNANKFMGTPGKKRVVGYSRVVKGSGAGLQIRKNIRQLIKDKPYWELDYVTTDHKKTWSQESTWSRFLNISSCYNGKIAGQYWNKKLCI